jgi:hypothetical protein
MRLTARMHDTLTTAARNPLRRTHDTTADWPAHAATLAALVRHGLLDRSERRNRRGFKVDIWTITDPGREQLNPPPRYRPDRPLFLAHCGAIRYRKLPAKGPNDLGRWVIAGTRDDASQSNSGDYTTNPAKAIDHLEVVDPADVLRFTATARQREQDRKRQNGTLLDAKAFDDRLEQARLVAREHRMDVTSEVWVIRQIAATGREQSATRRLAKLETQLQQRAA